MSADRRRAFGYAANAPGRVPTISVARGTDVEVGGDDIGMQDPSLRRTGVRDELSRDELERHRRLRCMAADVGPRV